MNEVGLNQVELAGLLQDSLGLSDTLSSRTYVLDSTQAKNVAVGWCSYRDRLDVNFVFSMSLSDVFSVASNGDPEKLGEVVAWVSDYHQNKKSLKYGDTCLIENSYLRSKGYVGCFISPPDISDFHEGLGNKVDILGSSISISALIFITNEDYSYCKDNGPKMFIDLLMESERSIIDF